MACMGQRCQACHWLRSAFVLSGAHLAPPPAPPCAPRCPAGETVLSIAGPLRARTLCSSAGMRAAGRAGTRCEPGCALPLVWDHYSSASLPAARGAWCTCSQRLPCMPCPLQGSALATCKQQLPASVTIGFAPPLSHALQVADARAEEPMPRIYLAACKCDLVLHHQPQARFGWQPFGRPFGRPNRQACNGGGECRTHQVGFLSRAQSFSVQVCSIPFACRRRCLT